MLGIRKAGEALANFDRAYADRAYNGLGGDKAPLRSALGGIPISGIDYAQNPENLMQRIVLEAYKGGVIGTNIGYRYGLPAAGVTLAGKGLYDLSANMSTAPTGELPM